MAGAFTACLVAAVLAFATQLIQHMPHNAQGAIVLSGVAGILQFGEAAFLWRVRHSALCQIFGICTWWQLCSTGSLGSWCNHLGFDG